MKNPFKEKVNPNIHFKSVIHSLRNNKPGIGISVKQKTQPVKITALLTETIKI